MLVETTELTLSHVGLGGLTEHALMALFGNAHSHCITEGRNASLRTITDQAGAALYPGYYMTHLRVPPGRRVEEFQVWDRIAVGVQVRAFGAMLLESQYVAGRPGEIPESVEQWDRAAVLKMSGANMFFVEGVEGEAQPSAPREGVLAALPKLREPPSALARFRSLRERGTLLAGFDSTLRSHGPLPYRLIAGRDYTPGHGIMFASFVSIMDCAERTMLTQQIWPPMSMALCDCLSVMERETYYFENVRGRDCPLLLDMRCRLEPCAAEPIVGANEAVPAGLLRSAVDIYDQERMALLVTSQVTKALAVPRARPGLLPEAKRLLGAHARDVGVAAAHDSAGR